MKNCSKKRWFIAYSYKCWIPLSIEGWIWIITQIGIIYGVIHLFLSENLHEPFNLLKHGPLILLIIVICIIFLFISRGHVEKRY